MATHRIEPLTADALDELPETCRRCLFWELGYPRPDPRDINGRHDDELASDPVVQKQAWCSAQTHELGPPGRIARVGDAFAGYALFARADQFASRRPPAPLPSDDALLLATLWVDPRHRELGIGRRLVQAAIKEALRTDLAAVEVYGDRRFREHDCVVPAMWLLHEGFEVHREHPRYPLLRLDTKRTARWTEAIEHAWDEVTDRLPRLKPKPAPTPVPEGVPVPHRTAPDDRTRGNGAAPSRR